MSPDKAFAKFAAESLQLNPPLAFDLWLNAFEYHRDPVKKAEFIRRCGGPPGELELAVMRMMLAGKVIAVQGLANSIPQVENGPEVQT